MGKQLLITSDVLHKVEYDLWADGDDRYFFDYDSYEIKSKDEIDGYACSIPLVHVSQVSVMKAVLADLNDRTISNYFRSLSDNDIWSKFWDHFDDDGLRSSRWHEFEEDYLMKLITSWCEDNGISYIFEKE